MHLTIPDTMERNGTLGSVQRRRVLRSLLGLSALAVAPLSVAKTAASTERRLALHNLHTGERVRATYWDGQQFIPESLDQINRVLRDHRSGEVYPMEAGLLDLLHRLADTVDASNPFEVISGYRSPATNTNLRKNTGGVARNSLHMQGKAIDIRLPGCNLAQLRKAALALRGGGVGYYPKSGFIHVDTGRVRRW